MVDPPKRKGIAYVAEQVHYMMDNGGYYCYCQVQPCQAASKVPMHVTISLLQESHKSLKLNVGIYHLDPFWFSHHKDGEV